MAGDGGTGVGGRRAKTTTESRGNGRHHEEGEVEVAEPNPLPCSRPAMSSTPPASATPVASEICWATALIAVAWLMSGGSMSEKTMAFTPVKQIERSTPPTSRNPMMTSSASRG